MRHAINFYENYFGDFNHLVVGRSTMRFPPSDLTWFRAQLDPELHPRTAAKELLSLSLDFSNVTVQMPVSIYGAAANNPFLVLRLCLRVDVTVL